MRTNLKVPYAEKDEARKRGARWDAARKTWYVENVENIAQFMRWTHAYLNRPANAILGVTPKADSKPNAMRSHPVAVKKNQPAVRMNESRMFAGAKYFNTRCACLPWAACDSCLTKVAAAGWGATV
jgi:hypothetical protein